MPNDYASLTPAHVRRTDRAIDDEAWIKALLHREAVGTIATVHNDQPFINSNLFVYDEMRHAIYFHTANVGRTRANVEQAPRVCFSVFTMGRLLPAAVALEFSVEYSGVVAFGTVTVVEDDAEAARALQLLLDKYAPHLTPGVDYRPTTVAELKRTSVYAIAIESWSGKRKAVDEDFPGAFWYGETAR